MNRRIFAVSFVLILLCLVIAAGSPREEKIDWLSLDFKDIEKAARSTEVTFYMWGGSVVINKWVDTYVSENLRALYGIELKRVPMDASIFVNKLLTEKQAGKETGTIDLLWINGENFKNAMEASLLYGPFAFKLPNFIRYVDQSTVEHDFGFPVRGYEAPYGRAQFVFEYDSGKIQGPPDTYEKLFKWIKNNPGRFSYPQPPDFTGSAFIRQVFYAVTGGHEQYLKGFNIDLFRKNSAKLWESLNEIKPYLWQEGKTYPKDSATLDTLFARGEVDFNMTYHQAHAQNSIMTGMYRSTVRTLVMKDGSIYNTHFTAIPFNAPNIPGAMVTANFLLSVEAQYSKNLPENWGDFTVLDLNRISGEQRALFQSLDLGVATLPVGVLAQYGVPEIGSEYLEALEQGWEEHVLRQ
jgi:putative spermidine/putrescine transport system substrate-binding protein